MTLPSAVDSPRFAINRPEDLREIWPFLLGMGIALIILGVVAIGLSFIATLATVMVFGILLLLGGLFQIVTALWGRSWKGFFLHLLAGVLYLVVGVFLIDYPVESAAVDALFIPQPEGAAGRAAQMIAVAAKNDVIAAAVRPFNDAAIPLEVIDVPELAQRNRIECRG